MAEPKIRPVVVLSPEIKKRLEESMILEGQAKKALSALKEIGMDVSDLEDKLNWAAKTREILQREFS